MKTNFEIEKWLSENFVLYPEKTDAFLREKEEAYLFFVRLLTKQFPETRMYTLLTILDNHIFNK